jgi:iron complex transport system permease protein
MYMWMLGSFSGRGWDELLFILVPSLVSIVLMFFAGRQLDLLSGGEMTALSLGVEIDRLRFLVIIAGSLASSAAVCAGGTIGFVGLIVPHVLRRIFGAKGRTLIPLSMVGGAALMLATDTMARVVARPAEIPVGTIMALLGAPFFISLVFSKRGLRNG